MILKEVPKPVEGIGFASGKRVRLSVAVLFSLLRRQGGFIILAIVRLIIMAAIGLLIQELISIISYYCINIDCCLKEEKLNMIKN